MIIKNDRKYVIATLGQPTMYLHSLRYGNYEFVDNISICSKTLSRKLANIIINNYYHDTGNIDIELVAIPLEITYSLVEE